MEFIIIIICVIVLVIAVSLYNLPTAKVARLEKKIHRILKNLALKHGGIELHDFMFKTETSSSQIDNMLLTSKAIYMIEAKNYNGFIFGSEEQENWTVIIKHVNQKRGKSGKVYTKTQISKHPFYNPIKQNQGHIIKFLKVLKNEVSMPIYNIVVFGRKATIKDITYRANGKTKVLNVQHLKTYISTQEKMLETTFELEMMMDLVDHIFDQNIEDKGLRKQHVKDVKEIQKKKQNKDK